MRWAARVSRSKSWLSHLLPEKDICAQLPHLYNGGTSNNGMVMKIDKDNTQKYLEESWCRCVVLKETLESPLDSKEIKSVKPIGNQP